MKVSTHSRLKAAADDVFSLDVPRVFQHTAA